MFTRTWIEGWIMSLQHSSIIWTTHSKVYFSIVSTNNVNYSLRCSCRLHSHSSNIFKFFIIPFKSFSKTKYRINMFIILQDLKETIESAFVNDHEILQFSKSRNWDKSILTKIFSNFHNRGMKRFHEKSWEQFIILSETVYFIVTDRWKMKQRF